MAITTEATMAGTMVDTTAAITEDITENNFKSLLIELTLRILTTLPFLLFL